MTAFWHSALHLLLRQHPPPPPSRPESSRSPWTLSRSVSGSNKTWLSEPTNSQKNVLRHPNPAGTQISLRVPPTLSRFQTFGSAQARLGRSGACRPVQARSSCSSRFYLPSIIIIPPSGPRPSQLAGRFQGIVLTLFSDSGLGVVAQPEKPKLLERSRRPAKILEGRCMRIEWNCFFRRVLGLLTEWQRVD